MDSVLYHVFVSKQYILCSALRHKGYLTLPYTLHRFGFHSTRNFRPRFYQAAASQPRVLSRRGCSLAIMFKEDSQILELVSKMSIRIQFVTTTGPTFSYQKLLFLFLKAKLCSLNRLVTRECRQNIVSVKFLGLRRGLIRIHHKLKYIIYFSFLDKHLKI